jgi:hypothetical protein
MSKEEPAWKAELEQGLARALSGSGLNIAARVTARDAILPPVWAAIRAAEQRGFQAGVNKTGDSVGKLREQLKTAREDARREAADELHAAVNRCSRRDPVAAWRVVRDIVSSIYPDIP